MGSAESLPPGSRLVHLGPPKTGTTAIQASLATSREALLRGGVDVLPRRGTRAWEAGLALIGGTRPGLGYEPDLAYWDAFAAEVRASPARVAVVSNEAFAKADHEAMRKLAEELGGPRAHYLYVLRRIDKLVLSHWQESVKGGDQRRRLSVWAADVFGPDKDGGARRNFWLAQDVAAVVGRLTAHVRPEQVTLLVAREGDTEQLPRLFEELLGVATGTIRPAPQEEANRSLSASEAELIRLLNVASTQRGWSVADRRFLVKRGLVNHLIHTDRWPGDERLQLPVGLWTAIAEATVQRAAAIDDLTARGVRLIGDPSALEVPADAFATATDAGREPTMSVKAVAELITATVEAALRRAEDEAKMQQRFARHPEKARGRWGRRR